MFLFFVSHHTRCLFATIIILILLHDWSTNIITAYVAPPSTNFFILLRSISISRRHLNNKYNRISYILNGNNSNKNDYIYQEDSYKDGKEDNNDNYDPTNTRSARSAKGDSIIVSDEIAFRACYVYLQRRKRLGPWLNEIERKKKQLIEKEEYIESLQQSRRTFQEQRQRHKLGKQQTFHEEQDLEQLRSENAIDNNMYDSSNSNDNTIVLHSRIGRQNLVQQDIALNTLLREDNEEEDYIDDTEQFFYRNTNYSNKNVQPIGRITSVGNDNDNDDDYNDDDDDDANEMKQMKNDIYWENYDTITTTASSSSSSERSNEASTHSTTRSSSTTSYGDYYYDSNNAKTSSSSYTTSSSSYYKINDETPSKQHVKRSKAALRRWADPEWKQKWYEKRWGANSNSRSNMKQTKQQQQPSSTLPFLYQPQSNGINLNNVNNKKKDIDYYLELYKQSQDLQQRQEEQQQSSSTASLSNKQLTSNDVDFLLPISTFTIDTAADGGYYNKQQQQKQHKNQIIVSKSINEIATNMNENEIDFAIQSYLSSNQKRIVSRQRTIQQRKRLIQNQQKELFQTPQSTTVPTEKVIMPEQKQSDYIIAVPSIFTSFYASNNKKNKNENSTIMHNFLLQQKQKRSERATRAYQKRRTNTSSKNEMMASKVEQSNRVGSTQADTSMSFGQKNNNSTSSSTNNSTKASSAYQRMNLVNASQILEHHQNSLQSAFTPMERLQRIEWFLDEYCKHKKNEKQQKQQQQQSENEQKLWTFDDYCEHGYYVSTVGTGVISNFFVNEVSQLDRRHIISPSTANDNDSNTCIIAATSPILSTILPDYFVEDIEAILIPTKLSRRRHVLRRILDVLFNLRGRCILTMSTISVTTSATTKITTAPSLSCSQVDTSADTLLFTTQCSIFELGSFVLLKVRDSANQQQLYQQQTTTMYRERSKFILSKSPQDK